MYQIDLGKRHNKKTTHWRGCSSIQLPDIPIYGGKHDEAPGVTAELDHGDVIKVRVTHVEHAVPDLTPKSVVPTLLN